MRRRRLPMSSSDPRRPRGELRTTNRQDSTAMVAPSVRELKKIIFLLRDIDAAAMAGVSLESCRFVVLRSPRGRLGSELDMGSRLRRMRGRRYISGNSLNQTSGQSPSPPSFGSRTLWRPPSTAACGVGDHPTSDLSQRASASRSVSEKSK